ncbi:hypothetical protein JW823_00640 [bacterium]|nr:hypothetical protein [candidate division CSSED10-310 bacterium]
MKLIWAITVCLWMVLPNSIVVQADDPAGSSQTADQKSGSKDSILEIGARTPETSKEMASEPDSEVIREQPEKEISKMNDEQAKKKNDAHQYFAIELNNEVWGLLQKPDRSDAENERMIYAAHGSCYHWLKVGTGVNHQRGEWLIARVYTDLGMAAEALRHASRCMALTDQYHDLMQDFDRAYAQEAMARANALAGRRDEALKHRKLAEKLGKQIAGEEDRNIFMGDFTGGNWYGLDK